VPAWFSGAIVLALASCSEHDADSERRALAGTYVSQRTDIVPAIRRAILAGKVAIGMAPEEARVAAGACVILVSPRDPKWPEGTSPMQIAIAQRLHPDSSGIMMRFCTAQQFNTREPEYFNVYFEKGRALRIVRDSERSRP